MPFTAIRGPALPPRPQAGDDGGTGAGGRRRQPDGPALFIQTFGPGLRCEWFSQQKLPGLAVQHVVKGVAMRPINQLPTAALKLVIHQHRHLNRVPIVHVVGYVLEIPFELSAVCVECDGTV